MNVPFSTRRNFIKTSALAAASLPFIKTFSPSLRAADADWCPALPSSVSVA